MTRFDITMSIDVMLTKLHSVLQHSHTLGPVVFSPLDGPMALQNLKVRKTTYNPQHVTLHSTQELWQRKTSNPSVAVFKFDSDARMFWRPEPGRLWKQWTHFSQNGFHQVNQQIYSGRRILLTVSRLTITTLSFQSTGEYIESATIHWELKRR